MNSLMDTHTYSMNNSEPPSLLTGGGSVCSIWYLGFISCSYLRPSSQQGLKAQRKLIAAGENIINPSGNQWQFNQTCSVFLPSTSSSCGSISLHHQREVNSVERWPLPNPITHSADHIFPKIGWNAHVVPFNQVVSFLWRSSEDGQTKKNDGCMWKQPPRRS